ncbi:unnamed protein product [Rotaria sp. Silwood2]|nr:unnamed protein product [Rotaria sp. Silwood2]CAF2771895.1 unnamed protein product [Rotaria sp. Silwood2]
MNTTRLMLDNAYNLFIPISDNCIKLKNNQCNTFLLYFGLPNSRITTINTDDILISTSESKIEFDSNKLIVSDIPIFAPLKADVNGNINKLRRKMNENMIKFQTLYSILNDEIEARTTNARNSATDALLWLKRTFEFVSSFLHEFSIGDKTLADAVGKAYEKSLRKYHGMLARSVFSASGIVS